MFTMHRPVLAVLLAIALCAGCASTPPPAAAPQIPGDLSHAAWAQDMERFAAEDATNPPPKGAVLFVGSSSIRMWATLAQDFPGVATINRGFGGSEVRDSTWYADRVVVSHAPRMVVFYAGDNDINSGRSPQQVRDDFIAFVQRVRRDLPKTRIAVLSIKPSLSRIAQLPAQREANILIREAAAGLRDVDYIDVATPMLDTNGQPRAELFGPDGLHMSPAGYALWRDIVAPYLKK